MKAFAFLAILEQSAAAGGASEDTFAKESRIGIILRSVVGYVQGGVYDKRPHEAGTVGFFLGFSGGVGIIAFVTGR